jgi:DNA topoisomerase-6 subunit B
MHAETYLTKSPAEFFLTFKETAGLDNPKKVIYITIRELVENSLDACEVAGILPEILVVVTDIDKKNGWYEIKVRDNGIGVPGDLIPDVFGRLLLSSKYELKQSRGLFGLGGKLVSLYGSSETGKPFKVVSSIGDGVVHGYKLRIDEVKNKPVVINHVTKKTKWKGTIISVITKGNFKRAFPLIRKYLQSFALINPYVNLRFVFEDVVLQFNRVTKAMPKPPKKIRPHPKSIRRFQLIKMMEENKNLQIADFMVLFHRVGKKKSHDFLKFVGMKRTTKVGDIVSDEKELNKFYGGLHKFDGWIEPNVKCLSTLGENLFLRSVHTRVTPQFATYSIRVGSYSGLPFAVEVVSAFGGNIKTPKNGRSFNVHRFANRMPLITNVKDAIYHTVIDDTNFGYFKITKDMPIEFFVHLASIRIPYKSQGKESIAETEEITKSLHLAVIQSLKKLSKKVKHKQRALFEMKKSKMLIRYLKKTNRFVSSSLKLPEHKLEILFPKLFKPKEKEEVEIIV